MEYEDFELRLAVGPTGTPVLDLVTSPLEQSPDPRAFPLHGEAITDLAESVKVAVAAGRLDARSGASRSSARGSTGTRGLSVPPLVKTRRNIRKLGERLFDALLAGPLKDCYSESRVLAKKGGRGLRIRVRVDDPRLANVPWEFIHDGRDYVCLSKQTPLIRELEIDSPQVVLPVEPPLRILGMSAVPSDQAPLDWTDEKSRIELATEHVQAAGLMTLRWLARNNWEALYDAMATGPWHVFHFIGHGAFDPATDEGQISLVGDEGTTATMSATELARLLGDHESLRLVILNSCEGARGSETEALSSTASALVRRGIPAVVGMQYEITDRAAIEFTRFFYQHLALGAPVDEAVTEARKAISISLKDSFEWGTPALHLQSFDGTLVDLQGRETDEVFPSARESSSTSGIVYEFPPLTPEENRTLRKLLAKVKGSWIEGVLERSVHHAILLQLDRSTSPDSVDHPWATTEEHPDGSSESLPTGISIGDHFNSVGRSLLILGEPGSGKTITMLELARDFIRRSERDPGRAVVPVVFILSAWSAGEGKFADFLTEQLAEKYGVPRVLGLSWLRQRRLLLLLDGLDEVPTAERDKCVRKINDFSEEFGLPGLVVCSRIAEYSKLSDNLRLHGAIRLQPLNDAQIEAYLTATGSASALHTLMAEDPVLREMAESPLMLSIMSLAYRGLPLESLKREELSTMSARRTHLFDAYVDRMFARKPEELAAYDA